MTRSSSKFQVPKGTVASGESSLITCHVQVPAVTLPACHERQIPALRADLTILSVWCCCWQHSYCCWPNCLLIRMTLGFFTTRQCGRHTIGSDRWARTSPGGCSFCSVWSRIFCL